MEVKWYVVKELIVDCTACIMQMYKYIYLQLYFTAFIVLPKIAWRERKETKLGLQKTL